ncbi:MAG: hypothetical protein HQL70_10935 [Magnetococcales bacterium]|nr:hypothetical protein [Magnetococcales bacterium]
MLIKTLLVTVSVLLKLPAFKEMLGDSLPLFWQHIEELNAALAREPNADFIVPLNAALNVAFSSPAEPIIDTILKSHELDYRFITGNVRNFSALKPGREVPEQIQSLWLQAREAGQA